MIKRKLTRAKKTNFVLVTIFVTCILTAAFVWFISRLHQIIADSNNSLLKEYASHQTSLLNNRLQDQLSVLNFLTEHFEHVNFDNPDELKATLQSLHKGVEFRHLAVADSSGTCIDSGHAYPADISDTMYFQSAMRGESFVVGASEETILDKDIFTLSVPIRQEKRIVGVLIGAYERSALASLFDQTDLNSRGYTYVINSKGQIIINANNVHSLVKGSNYLDFIRNTQLFSESPYENIVQDLSQGSSSFIHYQSGSEERYAAYYPTGWHDWYVVYEVSDATVFYQTRNLDFITAIFISILVIILLGIFLLILSTMQKIENIMEKNESFRLISTQNQSVIFDYNIKQQVLDLTGDTTFIFGSAFPSTAPIDMNFLLERVHPDDISVVNRFIRQYADTTEKQSFEFRFRCNNRSYYWFRFSSTLIQESNLPFKLVGNFVNVENQKNQELSLRQEAEQDSLTGLLNKKAMASYVESFLKKQKKQTIHAFFIIDLDNFKQINDTFGHVYGDKVLTDTASRLSAVFSEKDFIGRIGGDEFAAFLNLSPFDDMERARRIITQKGETLQKELHHVYRGHGGQEITVSASIGIAVYSKDGSNYLTLYSNADNALYRIKEHGKNGFTFYTPEADNRQQNN